MTQHEQAPAPPGEHGDEGDYGYDLAHESGPDASPARRAAAPPRPCVTRQPEDEGGDLSYDLAHDVPPSSGR